MASNPLDLPEIIAIVLQFADSKKTLVVAAQVNSRWADLAINLIWRGVWNHTHFCHCSSMHSPLKRIDKRPQQRRDWYTKRVRHLNLGIEDGRVSRPISRWLSQGTFSFPNLKSVHIDLQGKYMKEVDLVQLLSPTLICLRLFGGHYTRWFLEQIKIRAPNLGYWEIQMRVPDNLEDCWTSANMTAKEFLDFFANMPSIKHIIPRGRCYGLMDENFIHHCLLRPNLEVLDLPVTISPNWNSVKNLQRNNPSCSIFPRIRSLEITADSKTLQLILPGLKYLQYIKLRVRHDDSPPQIGVLESLASSSQLESVTLYHPSTIPSDTLLHLALRCPLMRRFTVDVGSGGFDNHLTDELLDRVVSSWKHLEILELQAQVDLSIKSLISIALHCPCICRLSLQTAVEIGQLQDQSKDVHFPSLTFLNLHSITSKDFGDHETIADFSNELIHLLESRFPLLSHFWFEFHSSSGYDHHLFNSIIQYFASTEHGSCKSQVLSPDVPAMLTKRLLEPVPGSRFNPLS